MNEKDNKKKPQEIVVAVLAGIVFVTALFIINNITESDNNIVANTQAKTQSTEAATKDMLDNGKVIYHRRITQLGREFILQLFNNVA